MSQRTISTLCDHRMWNEEKLQEARCCWVEGGSWSEESNLRAANPPPLGWEPVVGQPDIRVPVAFKEPSTEWARQQDSKFSVPFMCLLEEILTRKVKASSELGLQASITDIAAPLRAVSGMNLEGQG